MMKEDPNGVDEIAGKELNGSDTSDSTPDAEQPRRTKSRKVTTGRDLGVWESSLEDQANCYSLWALSFLNPLLSLGANKVLDAEDIGVATKEDEAERVFQATMAEWEKLAKETSKHNKMVKEKFQKKLDNCKTDDERKALGQPELKDPSIATALLMAFGKWKFFVAIIYYVVSSLMSFIPVLILNQLVRLFESGEGLSEFDTVPHPWAQVGLLAVVPVVISILQTRSQNITAHCAVFARTAVSTMLYRKSLRISAAGRATTSTGQVVNMMSNDTAQLQRFLQFIGLTLVAPVQIFIALYLIFQQVGNATWVGVGYMVILAPVNVFIFSIVSKQRRKVLHFSDLRVKMMNEILSGIRIIKFYAWERSFGKEVGKVRKDELDALTKLAYTVAIGFSMILLSAPLIQPILVFATYVSIQDEPLDAATAFTTVALFNIMRFPFAFMPMGLLQYIQSKISLKRLERYLDLPELGEYVENTAPPAVAVDSAEAQVGSVTIQNGSFGWSDPDAKPIRPVNEVKVKKERRRGSKKGADEKADADMSTSIRSAANSIVSDSVKANPITLQDLSFTIPSGSLVAVIGEVGSGKSSFLSAIMGEMEPINNSKVYVPRPSDYQTGFMAYCAQTPWVVNDTLRGNVLFGRPFDEERYNRVIDVCALKDDLAVLPAGDMTEIGERGINLSGGQKARVSLARAFYSSNTRIMMMDDPLSAVDAHVGEHIFSRAITGELSTGVTRILVTHHVHLLPRCDSVIVLERGQIKHHGRYQDLVAKGVDFAGAVDVGKAKSGGGTIAKQDTSGKKEEKNEKLSDEKKAALQKSGKKLVKDEEREEGNVDSSAYFHYAEQGGTWTAISAVIVQAFGRGFEIMSGFWLALWARDSLEAAIDGDPHSTKETYRYLGVYALFGMLGVFCLTFRALIIAVHRLRASIRLHDDVLESVLRAPVAFFDVTPTGRILNRFAADMDKVDLELTQTISQGMTTLFSVLGAIGAIIAATKGTFLVPLVPLGYLYYLIQKWFRKTSTELQRINSIANSPIFADFSQTLSGTPTIRAYGEEERFFRQCKSSFDVMNASYILVQQTGYWLGLRLDILGGIVGAFIAGVAVATRSQEFIPAGWLGLALTYSIEITNYLKHGVRMIATIEAQMNSVERILFYTNNVEPEAAEFVPEKDPADGTWPVEGRIQFNDTSMRYRDGPLVLKGISVDVKGGEKVGVAGRTGSGKSSLMISLFRISEVEKNGGGIEIDGINTAEIGLDSLRKNISIIPQDPIVFSNTVRFNLDPFAKCSDEELWSVLKKVKMDEVIAALPGGLEEQVAEGGENFSQGQRQLLCIARSLLRKPKILIMDEATASIDNATDAAIQTMIRENFADATVLTIAHRLNTIMDSDRVLILDDGRVAEYDSPQNLLKKRNGLFRAMVEKSRDAKNKH